MCRGHLRSYDFWADSGIAQRIAHDTEPTLVLRSWLGHVVRVAAHAVADNFGNDVGSACFGVFQLFQDQDARAFADHESVAVFVPGTAGVFGIVVARGKARMAANPPTPIGVMAASVPPAIITSASLC